MLPTDFHDLDLPPTLEGGLAAPIQGNLTCAHAHQRSGGGLAQGANTYPDIIGTFGGSHRGKETADWVPHVQKKYGPIPIVGTGWIKDARCGRFKPLDGDVAGACQNEPENHRPMLLPIGCSRKECPEDWNRWARKGARRAENVVNGYLTAKFKDQAELIPGFVPRYLPDHLSVHPSKKVVKDLVRRTEKALVWMEILRTDYHYGREFHRIFQKKYNDAEKAALAKADLKNYLSVYHPIRLRKTEDEDLTDFNQNTSRYRRVLDHKDRMKHVKFSPHSHIVTDGSYVMDAAEFYDLTNGWTYRNHREVTNIQVLMFYLLSHASATSNSHSVRYLGVLHNMTLQGNIEVEYFPECPECRKEGKYDPKQLNFTVGKLRTTEYQRDEKGHLILTDWEWEQISRKVIRRTRIIPVYRLPKPGETRKGMRKTSDGKKVDQIPKDIWDHLLPEYQDERRYIQTYTAEEYIALPASEKPVQWV
jgi:hypothetical protein